MDIRRPGKAAVGLERTNGANGVAEEADPDLPCTAKPWLDFSPIVVGSRDPVVIFPLGPRIRPRDSLTTGIFFHVSAKTPLSPIWTRPIRILLELFGGPDDHGTESHIAGESGGERMLDDPSGVTTRRIYMPQPPPETGSSRLRHDRGAMQPGITDDGLRFTGFLITNQKRGRSKQRSTG